MKRIARIAAPVIAAIALVVALSGSALAVSPKAGPVKPGGVSTTIPVPSN